MRDFTINNKEKETYIKDIRKINNKGIETYQITFADGRKFNNITAQEDNLKKIIAVQEKQAEDGIKRKKIFVNKKNKYKFGTITGLIASGIIGSSFISNFNTMAYDAKTLSIYGGTLVLTGTVYSLIQYARNKNKVLEIDKIDYRNKNIDELKNLYNYENSLNGISKDKQKFFKNEKDPFSIVDIDNYSKKDLEAILSNIEREKVYNFKYEEKSKQK